MDAFFIGLSFFFFFDFITMLFDKQGMMDVGITEEKRKQMMVFVVCISIGSLLIGSLLIGSLFNVDQKNLIMKQTKNIELDNNDLTVIYKTWYRKPYCIYRYSDTSQTITEVFTSRNGNFISRD